MTTEVVRRAEGHVYIRTASDEGEAARLQSEKTVTGIIYDIDGIHEVCQQGTVGKLTGR